MCGPTQPWLYQAYLASTSTSQSGLLDLDETAGRVAWLLPIPKQKNGLPDLERVVGEIWAGKVEGEEYRVGEAGEGSQNGSGRVVGSLGENPGGALRYFIPQPSRSLGKPFHRGAFPAPRRRLSDSLDAP